jgi:MFS family permease
LVPQYGFVFGIVSLAGFISSPIFGKYGEKIGPKLVYNIGGFTQGIVGILFGTMSVTQRGSSHYPIYSAQVSQQIASVHNRNKN